MWRSDFIRRRLATGLMLRSLTGWMAKARSIAELEAQLAKFREHFNERRPHRAVNRRTRGYTHRATPKAVPRAHAPNSTTGCATTASRRAAR